MHAATDTISGSSSDNGQDLAENALRVSEQLARGQVQALTRTLEALSKESMSDRAMEHVLRTIAEQLGAQGVTVWEMKETSGLVDFSLLWEDGQLNGRSAGLDQSARSALSAEYVRFWRDMARTGKPAYCEDLRKDERFPYRDYLLTRGVLSILIIPMSIGCRVSGVLGLQFTETREFQLDEIALSQALAQQVMLAMELARLSAQSREAAVMAERNRLARDIHDTLAQGFTGIIVQLEAAADASSKGFAAEADGHLDRASALARESLREARRSVKALRPQVLEDKDLVEALKTLIQKLTAGTNLEAEFISHGVPRKLPADWDENLLRVGQEALTNVQRHAQARHFRVTLVFERREVRLELRDDGHGFDPTHNHHGFGLIGMKERVEGMDGRLTIESARGRGTSILITLPLPEILPDVS